MKKEITLGIDIGGTNTVFGFVDRSGNTVGGSAILTKAQNSAADLFSRLHPEIEKILASLGDTYILKGIGVGAPNANYYTGIVDNPPNLNWGRVDVVGILHQYYNIPVAITNDANASAIGEMVFGAARGIKDFIVVTLGTGLGSGIVCNGKLVYGSDGFAGELGHTQYKRNGRQCGCGKRGCLETYASATGIRRTVMELLADSNEESALRNVSFNALESKMIYTSALAGDPIALKAFEITGTILGSKLADAVAVTSPKAIILFGGLALAGKLITDPVKKALEENLFHVFKGKIDVLQSALTEDNSAVLGAAALIWNELLKD